MLKKKIEKAGKYVICIIIRQRISIFNSIGFEENIGNFSFPFADNLLLIHLYFDFRRKAPSVLLVMYFWMPFRISQRNIYSKLLVDRSVCKMLFLSVFLVDLLNEL